MNADDKTHRDPVHEPVEDAVHAASAEQAKARGKEILGKVKQKAGELTGNHELEIQGRIESAEAKAERLKEEVKEKVGTARDYVKAGVAVVKDKIDEARRKK